MVILMFETMAINIMDSHIVIDHENMGLDTQFIKNGVKIADLWVISISETRSATITYVIE